jgi:hypothetical protein
MKKRRGDYKKYADGGIVEQAKEIYDLSQNFPNEFEKAYEGFTGQMKEIYNFWKDVFGFRRGGSVKGRGGDIGFRK